MKFFIISLIAIGLVTVVVPHLVYLLAKGAGMVLRFPCPYRPFGIISLVLLSLWLVLAFYGHLAGRFRYERKDIRMVTEQLPEAFEGYRIVHISDLHLDGFIGHERMVEEIVDSVNALQPDAICFTGDIVSLSEDELEGFLPILGRMKARDGIFAVLGNHDYLPYNHKWNERERLLHRERLVSMERKELGWNVLLNGNAVIRRGGDSIAVIGCENQSLGVHAIVKRGDLKKAMKGTEGMWRILLTHDPTQWRGEVLGKTDIPLTLSGHTHGGQMNVLGLFYVSSFIYREHAGLYSENGQHLYVNIGIGGTMPMRIGATPEITLITLYRGRQ